ncbi:MAG: molybdopterin-dependent oxidoreductase [Terriglobales bacterium]
MGSVDGPKSHDPGQEIVIPTMCASHCGGNCLIKVHVRDGVITRVETDDGEEPQLRACARGRALRQRVYAPERILYPMKRVGDRGEGQFERISWDEALDTVAGELKRVRDTYGPLSILYLPTAGDLGALHTVVQTHRLLALAGGYTTWWGATSFHGGMFAAHYSYGTIYCANSRDDLLNSRLIILWGWNPATTVSGTNTSWYLAQAREQGTKIIAVDPWYSSSAATFAEKWIPIRPGTDAAMLIAMAYVMITERLCDQNFLATYTVGFDKFRDYVLGVEDGVAKTPRWAEAITGVPAASIHELAVKYATIKPAALMAGIAPGRTAYGEQYHRAAITLAAMTANVGIHGGSAAGRAWESIVGGYPYRTTMGAALPYAPNPVEKSAPPASFWLDERYPHIHYAKIADAILKGKSGGYPADYKLAFLVNSDYLNSLPNINKTVKALKALEFIVIEGQLPTATAKYADIILPTCTYAERDDIALSALGLPSYGYQNKVIEPVGESKPQNEIAKELAARLGIPEYDDKPADARLEAYAKVAHVPNYAGLKSKGVVRLNPGQPYVAFKAQIEHSESNRFPTPSGKIEIFSQRIADMRNPLLPPIPKYIEPWESATDPLARKYPLQLITNHFKRRSNGQFENFSWLKELLAQAVIISPTDADARGIQNNDLVRVFNDRGETRIQARVTARIMPGVVFLPEGAWYTPDENGVDVAGSANVLTSDEISPAGSFCYNTALVQVEKIQAES